jgi:hypothetical protein
MAKAINSWQDITLTELFYAFRKAKADCFFERSIYIAREFTEYENNLINNLGMLLEKLRAGDIDSLLKQNLGKLQTVAKKLTLEPKKTDVESYKGHAFFSEPSRAFEYLCATHAIIPEFRIVGKFPINMHVLSALWINLVGHKFDGILSKSAYGSRLRRYRPDPGSPKDTLGAYHLEAIGSFQPYFNPYRQWRNNGLQAIRSELKAEHAVIAVSMDLTSYYHNIDPAFMADPDFIKEYGVCITDWELEFTASFVAALGEWSKMSAKKMRNLGAEIQIGGLPIGLSISRIISNVLLGGLDRDIEQGLTPIYYGRYVDDMFIVLRDPGNLTKTKDVFDFFASRTASFPSTEKGKEICLTLPGNAQGGKTKLSLQPSKQKVFFLQGQGGIDLLDNIEAQIRSLSSERRLMPSLDQLESMYSAKVLAAAGHPSEDADTFRRADGLSVRRLGWSVQLRSVETLSKDLHNGDWLVERRQFYQFSHDHILRPDRILDYFDSLPRLLSLSVSLADWSEVQHLIQASFDALNKLKISTENVMVNGRAIKKNAFVWQNLEETTRNMIQDTILRSLRWDRYNDCLYHFGEIAKNICIDIGLGQDICSQVLALCEADWAKMPYKDHLRYHATCQRPKIKDEEKIHQSYKHILDLQDFLSNSIQSGKGKSFARISNLAKEETDPSLLPYLFPTRPYSTQEVSLFLPDECVFSSPGNDTSVRNWARYVRAVRGVWVYDVRVSAEVDSAIEGDVNGMKPRIAYIGHNKNLPEVRLGISSLLTTDDVFHASANGHPDISRDRYKKIRQIVNQAMSAQPRPTHLLLPELSLPARWIDTVSRLLLNSGISLIAGLDYFCEAADTNRIHSEAVLVLTDNRLGYPSSVQIRQAKSCPAAAEEEILLKLFGKEWKTMNTENEKPIYIHSGFCFGVLVCSELQNISHRRQFQGKVDCMMILSWNQDIETFSTLVESASLDVHAHIALVNNRRFGDSRVRTPAKEPYKRDACRLRGGKNEHVVIVELDIANLRAFQSRAKRWPGKDDPYKPVPEGFSITSFRRTIPA